MAHTYDSAVEKLDNFVQSKTSHSTKSILLAMQTISTEPFVIAQDEQDFRSIWANFTDYVQRSGISSIGRKQFEQWWNLQEVYSLPEDGIVLEPVPEPVSKKDELKELLKEMFEDGEIQIEIAHQSNLQHRSTYVAILIDGVTVASAQG